MILLFEKATISATSVAAASSGLNLDFWIIPAANLITISATQGKIILYFRDGNPYSETLATGEALTGTLRFATVTFNVTTGKEAEVAKNFYKFILAGPKPIVPIPSVRQIFTFSNVTNEFADIPDITSIDTIKRYTGYDAITGSSGVSLPTGTIDGQIIQWSTSAADWILSSYTLPTADGTSGQVLTTDGLGAVTFQSPSASTERFVFTGLAAVDTAANERFIPLSAGDVDIATNDIRVAAIVPVDANIERIAIVANTATTNTVTVRMYKNYVLASTNSSVSLAANVTQVLTPTATSFTAGDVISVSIEQDPTAVDLNFVNITVSLTT